MSRVIIPSADYHALRALECDVLQAELDRADVVAHAEVPDDVVTMHASVLYVDESTGEHRLVQLVYPHEADPGAGRVSVLAPVGAALLGLAAGEAIDWEFPHGRRGRLRVLDVVRHAA